MVQPLSVTPHETPPGAVGGELWVAVIMFKGHRLILLYYIWLSNVSQLIILFLSDWIKANQLAFDFDYFAIYCISVLYLSTERFYNLLTQHLLLCHLMLLMLQLVYRLWILRIRMIKPFLSLAFFFTKYGKLSFISSTKRKTVLEAILKINWKTAHKVSRWLH